MDYLGSKAAIIHPPMENTKFEQFNLDILGASIE
jgi:hypothetical protein